MHFTSVTLLALAAAATAENIVFVRSNTSPAQLGLLRRQGDSGAYEPGLTECGEGATCAEACGAEFEKCPGDVNYCFNPAAGETCCGLPSASCEAGFFCAHDEENTSVCCTEGTSLEDCAGEHGVEGPLLPDPPVEEPATTSAEPTTAEPTTSAEPTAEPTTAEASTTAEPPASTSGSDEPAPTTTDPVEAGAGSLAPVTAAALLVVGAVAAMF